MIDYKARHIARLQKEWEQYGRIIIAVDFDDTISPWREHTLEDCLEVIKILREAKQTGAHIVVFTACNEDRYAEIKEHCAKHGLEIDTINANPIALPYGNDRKVYANIFIDDRGGLGEALEILDSCIYRQRSYKQSIIHRDEIG